MSGPQLNQLEYCYLVEDTDPKATQMKIFIPKLMGGIKPSGSTGNKQINTGALMNDGDGVSVAASVSTQNYILAKVVDPYEHKHKHHDCPGNCVNSSHGNTCCGTSILSPCPHFHHDHHFPHIGEYGIIPSGTKMICLVMDGNLKDIWVTRFLCRW